MTTFITIFNYKLSYLEFYGVVFNLLCVIFAALNYKSNWLIGNIGVVLFGVLFYKNQLYSDVLLQCFFFILGLVGHKLWRPNLKITSFIQHNYKNKIILLLSVMLLLPLGIGFFMMHIHELFSFITKPATFPILDSYILVWSIIGTFLLINRKLESWIVWMCNDILAIFIYFNKSLLFLAILYVLFFIIALFGFIKWLSILKN